MSEIISSPFSENLLKLLAKDIIYNHQDIFSVDKSIIILPTRRAARSFKSEFLEQSQSKVCLLPRIITYADIPNNLILFNPICENLDISLPEVIDSFSLELIILELIEQSKARYPKYEIFQDKNSANYIKSFLTKFFTYNTYIPNLIKNHQDYKVFVQLITNFISKLKALGRVTDQQLHNLAISNLEKAWKADTTPINIYAVLPVTDAPYILKFLKLISSYSKSKLYVHGTEPSLFGEKLNKINEQHSFYFTSKIIRSLENIPISILKNPDIQPVSSYKLIECDHLIEESKQVSYCILEHLQNGYKKIGIITENQVFTKLIKEHLRLYDIEINDTTSENIITTKEVSFLLLLLELDSQINKTLLLSFLKHDFINLDRTLIENFEITFLRKPINNLSLSRLSNQLKASQDYFEIVICLESLQDFQTKFEGKEEFLTFLKLHLIYFKELIKDSAKINQEVIEILEDLSLEIKEACYQSGYLCKENYRNVLLNLLASKRTRQDEYVEEVQILTPVEARLQKFDLTIIPNLNENHFPKIDRDWPLIDPFLAKHLNFPNYQVSLGFYGYDFESLIAGSEVIFTRSLNDNGQHTVESRFLTKLKLLTPIISLKYKSKMETREILYQPFVRPTPKPHQEFRPSIFSVSAIETLIGDPYSYYIKYILKLKPLENLETSLTKKNFGIYFHRVIAGIMDSLSDLTVFKKAFITRFTEILKSEGYYDDLITNFWLKRLDKILPWLYNYETNLLQTSEESLSEKRYEALFPLQHLEATIHAIFDRLIIYSDGSAKIIDYKTGYCPSQKEIDAGLYPQFPLENLILSSSTLMNFNHIFQEYVEVIGKKEIANIKDIKVDLISTKHGLTKLLETFLNPENSYFPVAKVQESNKAQEYSHIIRLEEWFDQN